MSRAGQTICKSRYTFSRNCRVFTSTPWTLCRRKERVESDKEIGFSSAPSLLFSTFIHSRMQDTLRKVIRSTTAPYKVPSVIDWMLRVVKRSPKLEMTSVALFVAFWISSLAVRLKIWPKFETNVGTHRLATEKKWREIRFLQ